MTGVENPTVIDFVGYNSQTDKVTFAMVEERTWNGSEDKFSSPSFRPVGIVNVGVNQRIRDSPASGVSFQGGLKRRSFDGSGILITGEPSSL
jgi:hypothetical protein